MKEKKIAVVVGYHPYDVTAFQEMWESFEGLNCYIQCMDMFTSSPKEVRDGYDAVVFYMMQHRTPENDGEWFRGKELDAMRHLGENGQGIVVLHHSLLALENWPVWKEITGLDPELYHDYRLDVPMTYHVVKPDHPILKGIQDFSMVDEAYLCDPVSEAEGMEILLTTDGKVNMNAVAWTKYYRRSKVFCYQSGHDAQAFDNVNFRKILYQGVRWTMEK